RILRQTRRTEPRRPTGADAGRHSAAPHRHTARDRVIDEGARDSARLPMGRAKAGGDLPGRQVRGQGQGPSELRRIRLSVRRAVVTIRRLGDEQGRRYPDAGAIAKRLRARLGAESSPDPGDYEILWSLEFRSRPPAEHPELRKQVARDVE